MFHKIVLSCTLLLGVLQTAEAQSLFDCKQNIDCALVDICGKAISVRADKQKKAIDILSEPHCAPRMPAQELQTHRPICQLNKCDMAVVVKSPAKIKACDTLIGNAYENCVIEEAVKQKDLKVCQGMGYTDNITECEAVVQLTLVAKKSLTMDFCDGASPAAKYNCFSALAKQDSRPEYCFMFEKTEQIVSCLNRPESLAKGEWEKLTPQICKLAKEKGLDYWSDMCYLRISQTTNNDQVCEKIKSHYPFFVCYRDLALKRNDPELCKMVVTHGIYPRNYDRKRFSESGCRYFVGNGGSFAGIDEYQG